MNTPIKTLSGHKVIPANWPAPPSIVAFSTTRIGGVSQSPYGEFNLGDHVGDDTSAVQHNRRALIESCEGLNQIQWLQQVHGVDVHRVDQTLAEQTADAAITQTQGVACCVMTADCLPILLCDREGREVAAVHAGWRSLVGGVIENTVAEFDCSAKEICAWLGPAISRAHFEVGEEVFDQFLAVSNTKNSQAVRECFSPSQRAGHYYADLYALAKLRLQLCGVTEVYGGGLCTFSQADLFYSYRRDGVTGRMASLIYRKAPIE